MKKMGILLWFETKRMLFSRSMAVYMGIYFINYLLSAVFFKLYGSEGTVLSVGNAQSFPIQHLQASYLFTGIFIAIYTAQITVQERNEGTVKFVLLRPVSRSVYYITRLLLLLLFSIVITLMMIALSYAVGLLFFGWGDQLIFHSQRLSGSAGVILTLISGAAFALSYFIFSLIVLVISTCCNRLLESVIASGILLIVGEYTELLPSIKQYTIFHQMYFFCVDIFEQSSTKIMESLLSLLIYGLLFGVGGYLLFRKKDLYV
ncbi:ABC transporter permease subunit [uncultured Enterococcus sp.]|uniref:ABC transporter permease subunit n=1 Tax=uncultured Enterococcus sp. TaxID=167972 RepID=UPI002AA5F3C5|nr:ABC transporter permease subunit [uncultured Enterococcus sp.]